MKVEKIKEENLVREYNVVVPANDIETKISSELVKVGKTAKVPGFRPNKIPVDVLRKKYLKDVMGQVLQDVVTESSAKVLADQKVRPALQPNIQIKEFDEGKDLEYTISLEIMPELPEVDLGKISFTKFKAEISDADIDELQKNILASQKDFKPVDRAAKNGDAVLIDFKGFVGEVAFEGGEAQGHVLELGSNSFIPGFEEQLVGVKAGDETKVDVKFPDEYHSEELKGKDAIFEIKVHEVQEAGEAEANDEFAKKIGFESLEKLREMIKTQIENDAENMSRVLAKKELFDILDEANNFELPTNMVAEELKAITLQINGGHDAATCDDETHNHQSDEEVKEQYGYLADRRVKLGLLITEIGVKNEVKVSQEDVNKAIVDEARRYPGQEMQVFEFFKSNPDQQERLKGPIIEEKVVDLIIEKANVKEEPKAFADLRDLVLESNKEEESGSKKDSDDKKKVAKTAKKKSTTKKNKEDK